MTETAPPHAKALEDVSDSDAGRWRHDPDSDGGLVEGGRRFDARDTYERWGPEAFGDVELLALVVGGHLVAAELLERFGGLDRIAAAAPRQLERVKGIGRARAVRLHAALQAGRRSLRRPLEAVGPVSTPLAAVALLAPPMRGLEHEELHALYLSPRKQVLGQRRLTVGSASFTVVDPRQVFRPAVSLSAAGVILAHNHPSGDPTPSANDRQVTRRCAAAGRTLGVELIDHLVLGGGHWVSLAEEGECG